MSFGYSRSSAAPTVSIKVALLRLRWCPPFYVFSYSLLRIDKSISCRLSFSWRDIKLNSSFEFGTERLLYEEHRSSTACICCLNTSYVSFPVQFAPVSDNISSQRFSSATEGWFLDEKTYLRSLIQILPSWSASRILKACSILGSARSLCLSNAAVKNSVKSIFPSLSASMAFIKVITSGASN